MKTMQRNVAGRPVLVDEDTGEVLAEVFFKTPFNHDTDAVSVESGHEPVGESLTIQSAKEEVDINNIVDRFTKTGLIPQIDLPARFGDWTNLQSWHETQSRIAETNAVFYELDPQIRMEYQNDPGRWERAVMDELQAGRLDKLKEMGIDAGTWRPEPKNDPPGASQPGGTGEGAKSPQKASGEAKSDT